MYIHCSLHNAHTLQRTGSHIRGPNHIAIKPKAGASKNSGQYVYYIATRMK